MIVEFPKTQFPPDLNPAVGMALTMNNGQGQQFQVMVIEVKEEVVVLDANHSLAGQDLTFDLELVSIDTPSKIIMP
jgi:peptidylprolyl isomerase